MLELLIHALPGLLPVAVFLAALVYLDSYKLVSLRSVITTLAAGVGVAMLSYFVNGWALDVLDMTFLTYSRYLSPVLEEGLKGAVIVFMLRTNRIGFPVDAAIVGFAVGTGFAVVENLYYLWVLPGSPFGVWIIRGFGTAIMHGGASALFAITGQAAAERARSVWLAVLPGFLLACAVHSIFNHFLSRPVWSTLGVLLGLPPLIYLVYRRSERTLATWLRADFDSDTEILAMINSGDFPGTPIGRYLTSVKDRFRGEVVADLLCYLRLHVELAMRAKGLLMMRECGFETEIEEDTLAMLEELRYVEGSIGRTGQLTLQPILKMTRKDVWQFYMLAR
jgi:protease PrsW